MNMPVVMVMVMVMVMVVPLPMLMAVMPEFGLVEQEKEHHPDQQGGKQGVRAGLAFKGLGQQVHEGGGQQGAGRQAQQVLGIDAAAPRVHAGTHQKSGHPDTADAGSQGGQDDL